MPVTTLKQQGFYDKFANAGAGLRNTLGTAVDLYNTYKRGGLEDQRRQQMAIQKAQSEGQLKYLTSQTTNAIQEGQRKQQMYQDVDLPTARLPLDAAKTAGAMLPDSSDIRVQPPGGAASTDEDALPSPEPDETGDETNSPGGLAASTPAPSAVSGVQNEGQPGALPAPTQLDAPAPGANNTIPFLTNSDVSPLPPPGATNHMPPMPGSAAALSDMTPLPPGTSTPSPETPAVTSENLQSTVPSAFNYNDTNAAIAKHGTLPQIGAAAFDNTISGLRRSGGALPAMALSGLYDATHQQYPVLAHNLAKGLDYLLGGVGLNSNISGENPGKFAAPSTSNSPAAPAVQASAIPATPQVAPASAPVPAPSAVPAAGAPPTSVAPSAPVSAPPAPSEGARVKGWNELSPELQNQFFQRARATNPLMTPGMVRQIYETQVMPALSGISAENAPLTPDVLQSFAFMGVKPSGIMNRNGTYNAVKAADTMADRIGGGAGGNGMVLRGADGVPYAQFLRLPDPATGKLTLQKIDIPPEARETLAGMSKGQMDQANSTANEYLTHEQPKTFFGQINPKMRAITGLLSQSGGVKSNQFSDMDLLNSYAGITRPGAVVRDSTIETDLKAAGVVVDAERLGSALIGRGALAPVDRLNIARAAKVSWDGYYRGVQQELSSAVDRVSAATKLPSNQLQPIMFGRLLDDPLGDGGQQTEPTQPSAPSSNAPNQIPTVNGPDDFAKIPKGSSFIYKGATRIKN